MQRKETERKKDLVVRNALREDIKGTYEIAVAGYEEAKSDCRFGDYAPLDRMTRKQQKEWFSEIFGELKENRAVFVVAEIKGDIVGYCYVRPLGGVPSELSHVGVLSIRVKKGFRGIGVGMKMMGIALGKSGRIFDIIELAVIALNEPAKGLYHKFGFKTWGIAPMELKRRNKYLDREYMYLKLKR